MRHVLGPELFKIFQDCINYVSHLLANVCKISGQNFDVIKMSGYHAMVRVQYKLSI